MDTGNSMVNTVLILAALGIILALWRGWIKLPTIGNPFGWVKLPQGKDGIGTWLWSGIVWLFGPVPLAFISAHVIMLLNPVSHDFMRAIMGKDWDDPARYFFIAGEIWFVFILHRLWKTDWAKYFIAFVPGIPLVIGLHLFLTAFFPQYNAFTKEAWTKIENMPAPQWSSKGSSAQAATTPTSVDSSGNQVLHLDRVPLTADCGKEGGPVPCFGTVETFSPQAEGPAESVLRIRPKSASLCWQPQDSEDVRLWAGNSLDKLEEYDPNGEVKRVKYHAFSGTTAKEIKFLIVRQQQCPDYTSWE